MMKELKGQDQMDLVFTKEDIVEYNAYLDELNEGWLSQKNLPVSVRNTLD